MESRSRTSYLSPFARWWWLIFLVVVAAEGAVGYTLYTLPPSYKSSEKLQIVAPGPQEVSLFGETRPQLIRDEVFLVQNNFIEIIKSDAIAQQAVKDVGLPVRSADILGKLTVSPIPNTDFVYVYLDWPDPIEGPRILSAHVRLAQEYFAKSRAKPASNARQFISQQLVGAKTNLDQADSAFARFKSDRRIADMDQEIKSLQEILTNLRLDRDRARSRGEIPATAALDQALNERYKQMGDLISTSFEFNNLQAAVKRAEATYNFLLEKEGEAILKENESLNVDYIQLLEEAKTPATPVPSRTREIAALGAIAGLLLGSLLALALDLKGAAVRSKEEAVLEGLKKGVVDVRIGMSSQPPPGSSPAPSQTQG